jgi:hypothetical protein
MEASEARQKAILAAITNRLTYIQRLVAANEEEGNLPINKIDN